MKKHLLLIFSLLSISLTYNITLASPFDLNFTERDDIDKFINKQNNFISKNNKKSAKHYILRGDAFFLLGKFDEAVKDYTYALSLDDNKNEAYLGRGLALARLGSIKEGIAELDIYIRRTPASSLAYTKRGVRYLWLNKLDAAQKDFEKALIINPANAEAHDDLGVIFSQKKMYFEAADHFLSAIEYDPTYQKAYHNIALISYLTGKDELALGFVNSAVKLNPNSKDTLLLKSKILLSLGFLDDASTLKDEAEFLPEGNWSESVAIK